MTLAEKMFGLEPAKVIWTQKDHSVLRIRRGDLVLVREDKRAASPVLVKETVYGPYIRVSFWPFLGYGYWVKSADILQRVEPTYWSSLVNFLRRVLKHRVK